MKVDYKTRERLRWEANRDFVAADSLTLLHLLDDLDAAEAEATRLRKAFALVNLPATCRHSASLSPKDCDACIDEVERRA